MIESALLPRDLCQELLDSAQRRAVEAGAQVELHLVASCESLTRFANNEIHQNVAEISRLASIRAVSGNRTARASTNRLDRAGIFAAVDEAVALARASEPDPELLPLYFDSTDADSERFSPAAAACSPMDRARGVAAAVDVVASASQNAAGIYSTAESAEALLNTAGLFRYYRETLTQFSITSMLADSSGWAKASSAIHEEVDPVRLAALAVSKAALSARPVALDPGHYTVILEPAAVLDLVGQIFPDFSGTAMQDQRSFLNDRLGDRLFGGNVSIFDDARHPLQNGALFDGEGVPRERLVLVDRGVTMDIARSRACAAREGKSPTGHGFPLPNESGEAPMNIVMAGGSASLESLVRSTARGILVTRLWYIREVEPRDKVMTGMTRDGTFLIENGEIVGGVRNFRFNQSVLELLRNVEALTPSVRSTGEESFDMVAPGIKAHGFHFTEVTRF